MAGRAARVTPALTGPLPPTPPPPCACVSRGGEHRRPRPSPPGSSRLSPASSVPSQEPGPGHAEPTGPAARALATGRGGPCRRGCLLSESGPTPRAAREAPGREGPPAGAPFSLLLPAAAPCRRWGKPGKRSGQLFATTEEGLSQGRRFLASSDSEPRLPPRSTKALSVSHTLMRKKTSWPRQ